MAEILKLDDARQIDLDRDMVEHAYDRWAPIYDLVFGGVFRKGRKAAIAATNKMGGRVLEVGVGTGISLPQYAPHLRIFGTDISEAMLEKARKRVTEFGLKNVEGLAVMDAEKLEFPDDSFDVVMAQYVVTAVPNPEAALDEFARVAAPRRRADHPDTSQRRCRHAPLHRTAPAAGGAPAWLPHCRIRLVALCQMAGRRTVPWSWWSADWCRRSATSRWCASARSTSQPPPDRAAVCCVNASLALRHMSL